MILYHGSYLEITKPDLKHSRSNVYEKPNLQICFRTDRALQQLHFEGSKKV